MGIINYFSTRKIMERIINHNSEKQTTQVFIFIEEYCKITFNRGVISYNLLPGVEYYSFQPQDEETGFNQEIKALESLEFPQP